TGPVVTARTGLDPKSLDGLVLDDAQARLTGDWSTSASLGGYIGSGYLHDGNEGKGSKSARFDLDFPAPGRYEVRLAYTANANRATNVPITFESADGSTIFRFNQQKAPAGGSPFVSLGTFRFEPGKKGTVVISNEGTNGHVIVDAVQCVLAK